MTRMCSRCGQVRAVFSVRERHGAARALCSDCLAPALGVDWRIPGDAARFLIALSQPRSAVRGTARLRPSRASACRVCGLTRAEARSVGLLGCPACYEAFGADIRAALGSIGLR